MIEAAAYSTAESALSAESSALGLPRHGGAQALIVGRRPMHPVEFTAWAQCAVLGAMSADAGGELSWLVPGSTSEFDLPPNATSSRQARGVVRNAAAGLACRDDLVLAASELTANAVQHGGGPNHLTISRGNDSIAIAVADARPDRRPTIRGLSAFAASGRGLKIINAISAYWGLTVYVDRKVMWCAFPT